MMTTVHQMGENTSQSPKEHSMFLLRFSSGDVEQAAIVNDRFGKRALSDCCWLCYL